MNDLMDFQKALDSLRKDISNFKDKIQKDITQFKQEMTEKFITHKYEVSDSIVQQLERQRSEFSKSIDSLQATILAQLAQMKQESSTTISEIKAMIEARRDEDRNDLLERLGQLKSDLMDTIKNRIRVITASSALLLLILGWLWGYINTVDKRLVSSKDIQYKELANFKSEIRDSLVKDITSQLNELKSKQERTNVLLELILSGKLQTGKAEESPEKVKR